MTLDITPINHIEDGTSKVISQYRGKPKFLLRLACYLNQIQHAEDQLALIHEAFRPDTAVGFRLDWIGRKVGQPRVGASDDVFRLYIKARIAANRSQGKIQDQESIAGLLLVNWDYQELPLSITLETSDALTLEQATAIWQLLQLAAPAGVPVHLVIGDETPDFVFDGVADDHTLAGGFDTVAGDATAGLLARVIAP
jgi:hypothetical protein